MRKRLIGCMILGILACKTASTGSDAELKVTNGEEVGDDAYPAVVMLLNDKDSLCTGVFVNDYQLITAAHCLLHQSQVRIVEQRFLSTLLGYKTVATSERLIVHPGYGGRADNNKDLGIVQFPRATSSAAAKLSQRRPTVGDPISFVGYGNNVIDRQMMFGEIRQSGADIKRLGRNRIQKIENGVLVFQGVLAATEAEAAGIPPGEQAGFGGGDSGGPVFNARHELIGITSAGSPKSSDLEVITAMDNLAVDLTSESSREFLRKITP